MSNLRNSLALFIAGLVTVRFQVARRMPPAAVIFHGQTVGNRDARISPSAS